MHLIREVLNESCCRACGAKILWARTAAGKIIPLDACPIANGNMRREMLDGSELRYLSHFATCPNADRFRRR